MCVLLFFCFLFLVDVFCCLLSTCCCAPSFSFSADSAKTSAPICATHSFFSFSWGFCFLSLSLSFSVYCVSQASVRSLRPHPIAAPKRAGLLRAISRGVCGGAFPHYFLLPFKSCVLCMMRCAPAVSIISPDSRACTFLAVLRGFAYLGLSTLLWFQRRGAC